MHKSGTITIEEIASVCHGVNRAYCLQLGDDSQLPWAQAPAWQRESAVNGVIFHLNNPQLGPEASHENWMQEKMANGWRHGPVKDAEKKEHPWLIRFEELPAEQQMKDVLFVSVVEAMKDLLERYHP